MNYNDKGRDKKMTTIGEYMDILLDRSEEASTAIEKLELEKQEMKGEIEELKKRLEEIELQSKPIGRDMEGIPNLFRIGNGKG